MNFYDGATTRVKISAADLRLLILGGAVAKPFPLSVSYGKLVGRGRFYIFLSYSTYFIFIFFSGVFIVSPNRRAINLLFSARTVESKLKLTGNLR